MADFLSVAERYNILSHCRLNTLCKSMVWDERRQLWTCTFQDTITGDTFVREAPVVVSAIGTLDRPNIPDIEGAPDFQGKIFHSARWDDSVDVRNKNVVVLGNGASATQFVPELVKEVAPRGKVTQLVKSAHWWTKRVSCLKWSAIAL
jgi:cation diffusion facilitator CzcD-associated flavoprotein CzcO